MVVAQRDLEKRISVVQDLLQVDPIGGGGPVPCTSWSSLSRGVIEEIWAGRGTRRMQGVSTLERWAPAGRLLHAELCDFGVRGFEVWL